MNIRPVAVSGIRATGRPHLGNYIGAMKNFPGMQEKFSCFFFIADYHTLTSQKNPDALRENISEIVLDYLAAGLDPAKSTIFAQSSVPEIAELALLLGMIVNVGELQRIPTFKEKVKTQPNNVNLGLFSYPVLMAADILIQKANCVPVGEDQLPHIEMTREIARRFNTRFGEVFPLPEAFIEKAVRVPGLDGSGKMGKSDGNTIDLCDSQEVIRIKIARAVTDVQRARRNDPGHPHNCNVYALHEFMRNKDWAKAEIKTVCESATLGCVECKRSLAEEVIEYLAPFQEQRRKLAKNPCYVAEVLRNGGIKAKETAGITIEEVRQKYGLRSF